MRDPVLKEAELLQFLFSWLEFLGPQHFWKSGHLYLFNPTDFSHRQVHKVEVIFSQISSALGQFL